MVALSDPGPIQGAFSTLVWMFVRVSLKTNSGKTFRMVCHPCQAAGTQLEEVYEQRMTGAGPSYRERQHVRVQ